MGLVDFDDAVFRPLAWQVELLACGRFLPADYPVVELLGDPLSFPVTKNRAASL